MEHKKFEQYTQMALSSVYAEQEEGNFHTKLIPEVVKHFFTPLNIPKHAYVLDIGCGQGTFMDIMQELDYPNTVGITYSKEDHHACEQKSHCVLNCDMSDMPVPSEVVDFIWCRQALEHSPYPLFTLYEFNRVLKKGGLTYIEVPSPNCKRLHELNANHYSILGAEMWASLMGKAGFMVRNCQEICVPLKVDGEPVDEKYLCFVIEKHDSLI